MPAGQATPVYVLGAVVGLVLGGSQALSRSLYGSMIPEESSAEFFGFFTVFSKASATTSKRVSTLRRRSASRQTTDLPARLYQVS